MSGRISIQAQSEVPALASNDRYAVHALLGRGGMALVSEATDLATQQRVALKHQQTLLDRAKQLRNAELFEREFHQIHCPSQCGRPVHAAQ